MTIRSLLAGAPALALLLPACSGEDAAAPVPIALEHIDCAVGGSPELKPACSVEKVERDGRKVLIVHHPDGGRRRFAVKDDGSGVMPMDVAKGVHSTLVGQRLDVHVGPDRYVFPATVKPDGT